ncbi:MAG: tetratricopeptide repeat protein [Magnetococcales bacterium]|nr:tetratricopeptide repeat protein [Magnetococcales bacterium]
MDQPTSNHGEMINSTPPNNPQTMTLEEALNHALGLHNAGNLAEAEQIYRQVLAVEPNHAIALHLLSVIALQAGRPDLAEPLMHQALASNPDLAETHINLADLLHQRGEHKASVNHCRRAIELNPQLPEGHNNLGNVLRTLGQLNESVDACRQAIRLQPDFNKAYHNLGNALRDLGSMHEAMTNYRKALDLGPISLNIVKSYLSGLLYLTDVTPDELFDTIRREMAPLIAEASPLYQDQPPSKSRATPPLRIGYLSSDMNNHPVGRNVLPLLLHHNPEAFEVYAYSDAPFHDPISARIKEAVHGWRETRSLSDRQVAELIHQDGIQVMIYLAGLFDGNRDTVAAHRPAPIQVSFHSGTTSGLETMDYWLTDRVIHPPDETQERFSEQLYRLPVFYNYPPLEPAPEINPPPMEKNGFITFASFNNPTKINGKVMDLWARILKALPDARLMIKYKYVLGDPQMQERMVHQFERRGVVAGRLTLIGVQENLIDHLAYYHQADIALDPFPFTGATTTFQALWMGVPVVTLMGDRFIGRMAGDIVIHAGLEELAAPSPDHYVAAALKLADDPVHLRHLRETLRERLKSSRLCDGASYARSVEHAYQSMWKKQETDHPHLSHTQPPPSTLA